MRNPFLTFGIGWSSRRRIAVAAVVLATLLAITLITAIITGPADRPSSHPSPASPSRSAAPVEAEPSSGTSSVPRISDPVQFAKAAAQMLWSYDTRTTGHDQQLAAMRTWMTKEYQYVDWVSVSAQMPTPALWARMADQGQYATAAVTEGHYPAAFKQALAEDPSAITKAHIYAVTVTGKQTIAWAKGGGGAEDRSITLAVQCRPSKDCTLVAIAPTVAP
ncbi:hypothetical protein [Streptomyces microflavus]|uniref:hypothetical protein n=1 Tax=Streptomyces microflavus TaxID=1919 RepID=UPI0037FD3827